MRSARRAATLTDRLLAFSRRQPLDPKPLNLNQLIGNMSDMLQRTLGEAVAIQTTLAGDLWWASADANQLESAILNLAVNARDAMPTGGKLTIETANIVLDAGYCAANSDVTAGEYTVIAVSDNGKGMAKELVGKAFEPFFTTKHSGQGTGLGLSQVYGFLKQSGGHAKIYSEEGEGTTVKMYLPRLKGEHHAPGDSAADVLPALRSTHAETILVLEDDEDVRAMTCGNLRELGYTVIEAADGLAALGLLETDPTVRLLFTDVGLPGLNGRQVADEARRLRPDVRVVFTSGYAHHALVHQGRLDPGVELLAKPFTFNDLAAKIRRALDSPDPSQ
jgi:CheY-like chemotaxis protein